MQHEQTVPDYEPVIPRCQIPGCKSQSTHSKNWLFEDDNGLFQRTFRYYCEKHAPKESAKF